MARKKLTLGEKIALAAAGNQDDDFPEDIEYDTSAKVIDLDEDHDAFRPAARSSLRTKNVQLLDEFDKRYSGEKVSRKKLAKADGVTKTVTKKASSLPSSEEDEDEDLDELDDDDEGLSYSGDEEDPQGNGILSDEDEVIGEEEDEDGMSGGGESGKEEDEDESMGSEGEDEDSDPDVSGVSGVQTLSLKDKEVEIEKGKATLNQLKIWDALLEVRIRQQKMLLDCNRLPQTEFYEEIISDIVSEGTSELPKIIEKSQVATKTFMLELLRLQEIMTSKNAETQKAISKKSSGDADDPMNEEITSEDDDEDNETTKTVKISPRKRKHDPKAVAEEAKKMKLEDFTLAAEKSFSSFIPHRNQTIQKWNDKTQFAGGKFNKKSASQQISTLRQIEQILTNKDRLLKRTQIRRSNFTVIGEPSVENPAEAEQEPNPEIFDDDDFYHQLLRELIERKTCNVNDPTQLSRHWLELQKLRTKLKRKVDTKASKGRKIRYDVHPKLVNFMAPQDNCNMSSAAVKELFGSLFGKTKDNM